MKQSRFTDSQIIAILKQAEAGTPVPEVCREYGISSWGRLRKRKIKHAKPVAAAVAA